MTSRPSGAGPVVAFFDVDGTLAYRTPETGWQIILADEVRRAVGRFVERGNVAVLSTGRGFCAVDDCVAELPFAGSVTLDGAHVALGDRVLVDRSFPDELLDGMVSEMRRVGMDAFFQGTTGSICVCPDESPEDDWGGVAVHGVSDLTPEVRAFGLAKVDFREGSLAAFRSSAFLTENLGYYDVGEGCHELVMPGCSKGTGARALLEALPERPSRVIAFGDSENDLSVLEVADVAVVMGSASERVRAVADIVAPPASERGVARVLEDLGLA